MDEIHIVLSDNSLHSEWRYWWLHMCTVYRANVTVLHTRCKWKLHAIYIYIYIYIYPYWVTAQNTSIFKCTALRYANHERIEGVDVNALVKIWIVIFRIMSPHSPISSYQHFNKTIIGEKSFW